VPTISNGVPERFSNAAVATSAQLVSRMAANRTLRENMHMEINDIKYHWNQHSE
jgi:hypothetical protein